MAAKTTGKRRWRGLNRMDGVVLLACLSVLAVVAVPRQLSLATQLRHAELRSLAAGLASALDMAHARWRAGGQPVVMHLPGGDVVMVNGYPSAATAAALLLPPETASFEFVAGRWQHRERPAPARCALRYAPPATAGRRPQIETELADC